MSPVGRRRPRVGFKGVQIDRGDRFVWALNAYEQQAATPRTAIEDNSRFAMRIAPAEKARLMRAASLENTDLKDFLLRNALRAADAVIEHAERVTLSERDSRLWLDLLDNPPEPNDRLIAAAKALPRER